MSQKIKQNCQSSYREDQSFQSQFRSSDFESKVKPIKKRPFRKKQYFFNHTVCLLFTNNDGRIQTSFYQKNRILLTKSTNIQNRYIEHAKKFDHEILEKLQKNQIFLLNKEKQRFESTQRQCMQKMTKERLNNKNAQICLAMILPALYGCTNIRMGMQKYP